jgi:hypothetical protein
LKIRFQNVVSENIDHSGKICLRRIINSSIISFLPIYIPSKYLLFAIVQVRSQKVGRRRRHPFGTGLVKSHKYNGESPKTKDHRPNKWLNLSPKTRFGLANYGISEIFRQPEQ